jgi:hypothetical protein
MAKSLMPMDRIQRANIVVRAQRVILDRDLAHLYGVPTKALKQAVKRNAGRFPEDFMFVLSAREFADWRSQFVTSNADRIGLRYAPMAFTEHGVVMLSSVLNSQQAVRVNIEVVRAFVRLRRMLVSNADLARRLDDLEMRYDAQFKVVFDAIRALMAPPDKARRSIGFKVEEGRPTYGARRRFRPRRGR